MDHLSQPKKKHGSGTHWFLRPWSYGDRDVVSMGFAGLDNASHVKTLLKRLIGEMVSAFAFPSPLFLTETPNTPMPIVTSPV